MNIIGRSHVEAFNEAWKGLVSCGEHQFLTDEPKSLGGQDQGAAPYDLLCSSLAACTMITLRMYAKHKAIDLENFAVSAEFFSHQDGTEYIQRHLEFNTALDEVLKHKLLAICEKTPVTKTLLRSVRIETQIIDLAQR